MFRSRNQENMQTYKDIHKARKVEWLRHVGRMEVYWTFMIVFDYKLYRKIDFQTKYKVDWSRRWVEKGWYQKLEAEDGQRNMCIVVLVVKANLKTLIVNEDNMENTLDI